MDALTPKSDPMPALPDTPAQAPAEPPQSGPVCGACGDTAVVNWQRRLTDDELAEHVRLEQAKRDQTLLLADPQLSPPVFPPLPDGSNDALLLLACAQHAIDGGLAGLIHQKTCTAPNEIGRWGCDCTPEPAPQAPTVEPEPVLALPTHWQTGSA